MSKVAKTRGRGKVQATAVAVDVLETSTRSKRTRTTVDPGPSTEPQTSGAKKDHGKENKSANKKVKKEVVETETEETRVRSVVIKKIGIAPVDSLCPVSHRCHVFQDNEGTSWDCMLNQTNIANNNNKYYLIQLLKEDLCSKFYVWMRWGRVGYDGQKALVPCAGNLESAKSTFENKFLAKTRNHWAERSEFAKVNGKYDLVKMDYSAKKEELEKVEKVVDKIKTEPAPESFLHERVQTLITMICDVKMMERGVIEMQYNTKKAPLGKITDDQIRSGYDALKIVADLILKKDSSSVDTKATVGSGTRKRPASSFKSGQSTSSLNSSLIEACNQFYTRIPHEFGFKVPPVIRTPEEVKAKIQLLEALGDIKVALSILNDDVDVNMNPVDRHYKQLSCDINYLDPESADYQLIEEYITSTHGATHTAYSMQVEDIFECRKGREAETFASDKGNRTLLFHGSRLTNWAGILGQGLRIAPPEAPVTGYMFGKGVYFADMSSKSANYCFATRQHNVGLMLLCEVALGKPKSLVSANYEADKLVGPEKGVDSVMGLGRVVPDKSRERRLQDGTLVPMGPAVNTDNDYTLNYNEFVVYNTEQIRMRYLARIKFNFK